MTRLEEIEQRCEQATPDCGDNSCRFALRKGGTRTNGGCRCNNQERSHVKNPAYAYALVARETIPLLISEIRKLQADLSDWQQQAADYERASLGWLTKYDVLVAEKDAWGNEFTAVFLAKEEIRKLQADRDKAIEDRDSFHASGYEIIGSLEGRIAKRDRALGVAKSVLALVATTKRPDGTYNRCRESCEAIAKEALADIEKVMGEKC